MVESIIKYRLARPEDKIPVSQLMVQAMDDLARKFVNSKNICDALPVFELFFQQKNNIYSYENTIVGEDKDGIVGSITGYDGSKYAAWRKPFIEYLQQNHDFITNIENETSEGEFYLDTVSVFPHKQGLTIGSGLIQNMIEQAIKSGHTKVGLLVDKSNPKAKRLYERLDFKIAGEKILLGKEYEHLVFSKK